MLVRVLLAIFTAAFFCAPIQAGAISTPSGFVTVDGDNHPIQFFLDEESGKYGMFVEVTVPGEYHFRFTGVADPDPQIAYGFAVTDFGAPSTFSFSMSSPIVPTFGPTEMEASLNTTLTDFTGDGVSMMPVGSLPGDDTDGDGILEIQEALANGANLGMDLGPGVSFGPFIPPQVGALYGGGPYVEPEQLGPPVGVFTSLSLDVAFTLSGNGDLAGANGFLRFDELDGIIPEPSTGLLAVIGSACIIFRRARSRGRFQV